MGTVVFLAIFVIIVQFCHFSYGWTRTEKDIRMPKELRVANEGLAHDDTYWYLSNQHFLYKTTANPMNIVLDNHHAIPEELGKKRYDHIGDIDVHEGIIYGGLESSTYNEGILAAWNTTDLSIIRYKETTQKGMPWVAIDTTKRQLYSAVWNDCCNLQIYDLDTFDYIGPFTVPAGLPREIQGGAFYNNDLYLAINGNCSVYKLDLQTKEISFVLSDQYKNHDYEMEGITFWDLSKRGLGVMHLYGNFMQLREKAIHSFDP